MSSASAIQDEAAGQQPLISALQLKDLPVEIVVEILSNLDFETFDNMLLVNSQLNNIIVLHWCSILPVIAEREFSPADGFFAALRDAILPSTLSRYQCSTLSSISNYSLLRLSSTTGLNLVLKFCRAVKRFEYEFPRFRFSHRSDCRRLLRPHELHRLRSALYIWWRYASAFHGPASCPRRLDDTPEGRHEFIHQFSSVQLYELDDLWRTFRGAFAMEVCPSFSSVVLAVGPSCTWEEGARLGWGERVEHLDILSTMMKLRPEAILHLLVYRHRYATKASVVQFVKQRHPWIEESMETLSGTLSAVMVGRHGSCPRWWWCDSFPDAYGGILDFKDAEEEAWRARNNKDTGSGMPAIEAMREFETTIKGGRGRLLPSS
ncbi:hypothetical protein C8A03DRAFT_12642 [Achaetomium macrosporum]|uniref:F-box domain-containing protein n=1 Tax=Achaetomium macrosporum TaxID=79813 RepID=A0AAN7HGH8_9PEZI|nr:hypothetical protein C8A03DRAFT_12642 [Achaetomium macrosporum]